MPDLRVRRLIGVYDADGGWRGEATYVVLHLLGRAACALCDVTHGPVRRKAAFDRLTRELGVPFDLVHRNERDSAVRAASGGQLPCVLAEVEGDGARTRLVEVLGPQQLSALGGDVNRFAAALRAALAERALTLHH